MDKVKGSDQQAESCVIWMHGLGADASDMAGLAAQLILPSLSIKHVFLDAPVRPVTINNGLRMRAWYDLVGFNLTDREDEAGIKSSAQLIDESISELMQQGFSSKHIFLAGFSQGAALALYTALHSKRDLAGVLALSGYLPLATQCKTLLPKSTPIFMAGGQYDPIVLPAWTLQSADWLKQQGYSQVNLKMYLMEHAICAEEIQDMSLWLEKHGKGAAL